MKRHLLIEVKGIQLTNLGSKMMLMAVMERFERSAICEFVIQSTSHNQFSERSTLGLKQKIWFALMGIPISVYVDWLIPQRLRNQLGMVKLKDIDLVLDCSGLAYTDNWIGREGAKYSRYFRWIRRRGAKVVMMPQAYGPADQKSTKSAIKKLCNSADLVYCRDRVSGGVLNESGVESYRVAPDFTCWLSSSAVTGYEDAVIFVPNSRMLSEKSFDLISLVRSLQELCERIDKRLMFIAHETRDDVLLVNQLLELGVVPIYEQDVKLVKGILGSCYAVVASRYHAVISALNGGTPCLATSWSHKYEELFREYEIDGIINGEADLNAKFMSILVNSRDETLKKITRVNQRRAIEVEQIFTEILECLEEN